MKDVNQEPKRIYRSFRKHKGGHPYASVCPRGFAKEAMQELLDHAIPGGAGHRKLYNAYRTRNSVGIAVFRQEYDEVFHAYPAAGHEVPPEIIQELFKLKRLTENEWKRLLRGR